MKYKRKPAIGKRKKLFSQSLWLPYKLSLQAFVFPRGRGREWTLVFNVTFQSQMTPADLTPRGQAGPTQSTGEQSSASNQS
jgi:hypothetical protein